MFAQTTQTVRILQILVASTITLTLFFTFSQLGSGSVYDGGHNTHTTLPHSWTKGQASPFSAELPRPRLANSTLDFQEIIYVSMPYRTDRQDALSLIAAISGLKLTMIPGVSADDIHPKAIPPHTSEDSLEGTPVLGIWRAHANVWRYIIDNDITSALIIEDDVDWDVNIKQIMGLLNWQLRFNNTIRWSEGNIENGWTEDCPYGCDWDELFFGQCGSGPNLDRLDLHQVYSDPHSPPLSAIDTWTREEMTQIYNLTESAGIRLVAATYQPICLMGYAVSRMGAMRLLYNIGGWHPLNGPVDNEIADRTGKGLLSGYTINPPLFSAWRVGGSQDSDNDAGMNGKAVSNKGNIDGHSPAMLNSVRKSLDAALMKNYWEDRIRDGR
ncbi:hypothetical protein B0J11DRAFT_566962 [Dendryphion nanum]|uniref:Glycosyltransferase family 25 protein n=1 Tax=Dendryphion nanum TaxID=256645 RepID=A0A9P9E039_9PLEO|nr:hypothetical protein B0J11DRAFT_566962 [Dendryphion nanum]